MERFLIRRWAFPIAIFLLEILTGCTPSVQAARITPFPTSTSPIASPTPFQTALIPSLTTVTFNPKPTGTASPNSKKPLIQPSSTPFPTQPATMRLAVQGQEQTLPLSCESRSAVDWAAYFGVKLDELEFQGSLPRSDNPEIGFVGDVNGVWGNLPPHSYGVYPAPVASLLQRFKLPAVARRGMTLEEIKREITAGRPVIVWVVGHVEKSQATTYTALNGQKVTVAPKEHTVMVVGFTPDTITVLDGKLLYGKANAHFLNSWNVLGNMGIVFRPGPIQ
jgi:uncharacterized protein YvpB